MLSTRPMEEHHSQLCCKMYKATLFTERFRKSFIVFNALKDEDFRFQNLTDPCISARFDQYVPFAGGNGVHINVNFY